MSGANNSELEEPEPGYSTAQEEREEEKRVTQTQSNTRVTKASKRSERLRIKSQRGDTYYTKHGDEFVYDFGQLAWDPEGESLHSEEETQISKNPSNKIRSSSWSNVTGAAAVVERRLKLQTPTKGKQFVKGNRKCQNLKQTQDRYRQKRIDLWFSQKALNQNQSESSDEESEEELEVYLKQPQQQGAKSKLPCEDNRQIEVYTQKEQLQGVPETLSKQTGEPDVCIEDNTIVYSEDSVNAKPPLLDYGSDFESFTTPKAGENEYLNQNLQDQSSVQEDERQNTQLNAMAAKDPSTPLSLGEDDEPLTVKHWAMLLEQMKQTVKVEVDKLCLENNKVLQTSVNTVSTAQDTLKNDFVAMKLELKLCQVQLNEVVGVTVRQGQELVECKKSPRVLIPEDGPEYTKDKPGWKV